MSVNLEVLNIENFSNLIQAGNSCVCVSLLKHRYIRKLRAMITAMKLTSIWRPPARLRPRRLSLVPCDAFPVLLIIVHSFPQALVKYLHHFAGLQRCIIQYGAISATPSVPDVHLLLQQHIPHSYYALMALVTHMQVPLEQRFVPLETASGRL